MSSSNDADQATPDPALPSAAEAGATGSDTPTPASESPPQAQGSSPGNHRRQRRRADRLSRRGNNNNNRRNRPASHNSWENSSLNPANDHAGSRAYQSPYSNNQDQSSQQEPSDLSSNDGFEPTIQQSNPHGFGALWNDSPLNPANNRNNRNNRNNNEYRITQSPPVNNPYQAPFATPPQPLLPPIVPQNLPPGFWEPMPAEVTRVDPNNPAPLVSQGDPNGYEVIQTGIQRLPPAAGWPDPRDVESGLVTADGRRIFPDLPDPRGPVTVGDGSSSSSGGGRQTLDEMIQEESRAADAAQNTASASESSGDQSMDMDVNHSGENRNPVTFEPPPTTLTSHPAISDAPISTNPWYGTVHEANVDPSRRTVLRPENEWLEVSRGLTRRQREQHQREGQPTTIPAPQRNVTVFNRCMDQLAQDDSYGVQTALKLIETQRQELEFAASRNLDSRIAIQELETSLEKKEEEIKEFQNAEGRFEVEKQEIRNSQQKLRDTAAQNSRKFWAEEMRRALEDQKQEYEEKLSRQGGESTRDAPPTEGTDIQSIRSLEQSHANSIDLVIDATTREAKALHEAEINKLKNEYNELCEAAINEMQQEHEAERAAMLSKAQNEVAQAIAQAVQDTIEKAEDLHKKKIAELNLDATNAGSDNAATNKAHKAAVQATKEDAENTWKKEKEDLERAHRIVIINKDWDIAQTKEKARAEYLAQRAIDKENLAKHHQQAIDDAVDHAADNWLDEKTELMKAHAAVLEAKEEELRNLKQPGQGQIQPGHSNQEADAEKKELKAALLAKEIEVSNLRTRLGSVATTRQNRENEVKEAENQYKAEIAELNEEVRRVNEIRDHQTYETQQRLRERIARLEGDLQEASRGGAAFGTWTEEQEKQKASKAKLDMCNWRVSYNIGLAKIRAKEYGDAEDILDQVVGMMASSENCDPLELERAKYYWGLAGAYITAHRGESRAWAVMFREILETCNSHGRISAWEELGELARSAARYCERQAENVRGL